MRLTFSIQCSVIHVCTVHSILSTRNKLLFLPTYHELHESLVAKLIRTVHRGISTLGAFIFTVMVAFIYPELLLFCSPQHTHSCWKIGSGQSIQTGGRLESASRREATCRKGIAILYTMCNTSVCVGGGPLPLTKSLKCIPGVGERLMCHMQVYCPPVCSTLILQSYMYMGVVIQFWHCDACQLL